MKKISFEELIEQEDELACLSESIDAMNVFTALSRDTSIRAMIEISNRGRPAVEACADIISLYCEGDMDIRLNDEIAQMAIDDMIRSLLEPHGYAPTGKEEADRSCKRMGIKEATTYKKIS